MGFDADAADFLGIRICAIPETTVQNDDRRDHPS